MIRFEAVDAPSLTLLEHITSLAPANPFNTWPYAAAHAAAGRRCVALLLRNDDALVAACVGYINGALPFRRLDIPSIADLQNSSMGQEFCDGLNAYCRRNSIFDLEIESYSTRHVAVPPLPGEVARIPRQEYILDLTQALHVTSSNHRRNAARAKKAGVAVTRTREPNALHDHLNLMDASMQRRELRGESVPSVSASIEERALLANGGAELFQAHHAGSVVSSVLALRAPDGAYYQSAGTSPEGMTIGASPLLIITMAELLQQDGLKRLNLGGAAADLPGLQRFKEGFGAEVVKLEAVRCSRGSASARLARRIVARAMRATISRPPSRDLLSQ